jgi:hypothetical protein
MSDEVEVVRRLFDAVERRDPEGVLACYAEDVEINEAAVLPYGGTYRGHQGAVAHAAGFLTAWNPYQGQPRSSSIRTFGATVPAPCVCCSATEPSTSNVARA